MDISAKSYNLEESKKYLELGANSIYLNYSKLGQFDLKELNKISTDLKKNVFFYLDIEDSIFSLSDAERFKTYIRNNRQYFSGFVLNNFFLINYLKKSNPDKEIIFRCNSICLNSCYVREICNFGIRKIILPKNINLSDLKDLTDANPEVIFIYNVFLSEIDKRYLDCNYRVFPIFDSEDFLLNNIVNNLNLINKKIKRFCSLCNLKEIESCGIKNLLVCDEEIPFNKISIYFNSLRSCLSKINSFGDYSVTCQGLFYQHFGYDCRNHCMI